MLAAAWLVAAFLAPASARAQDAPAPLARAYSHNDYFQKRPLFDALDRGFSAVEADVCLKNGKLLVGHTCGATEPDKTLQSMYLDPLAARVKAYGGGVYPQKTPFLLLIDVKSDAEPTYAALDTVLRTYSGMLTRFAGGQELQGAITVVISGNRAREAIASQGERYAAIDGDESDLKGNSPASLVPMVSVDWLTHFLWHGLGPFMGFERDRLEDMIAAAHSQGRKIRFYNTPDYELAWDIFYDEGCDYINTDHLKGLEHFLQARRPVPLDPSISDLPIASMTPGPALKSLQAQAAGAPWD